MNLDSWTELILPLFSCRNCFFSMMEALLRIFFSEQKPRAAPLRLDTISYVFCIQFYSPQNLRNSHVILPSNVLRKSLQTHNSSFHRRVPRPLLIFAALFQSYTQAFPQSIRLPQTNTIIAHLPAKRSCLPRGFTRRLTLPNIAPSRYGAQPEVSPYAFITIHHL